MNETIDRWNRESYERGYKEGYSKALEMFREQLELAIALRPIQIVVDKGALVSQNHLDGNASKVSET